MKFALTLLAFPILGMALAIPNTASSATAATDLSATTICSSNPGSVVCDAFTELEKVGADIATLAKGAENGKKHDGIASIAIIVKWVLEHPELAARVAWSRVLEFVALKVTEHEWEKIA